jgi:aspartokinase
LARIFNALAKHDIPIHVISQGASRINITLVTDPKHAKTAMRALHAELFT